MKKVIYLTLIFLAFVPHVRAQEKGYPPRWALKTNLLYGATTTPNLSVEVALSPKLTLDLSGSVNTWDLGRKDKFRKLNHWLVAAEARHWVYEKFDGHFLGLHAFGGSYNAGGVNLPVGQLTKLKENRYEGYALGAGLSYGYVWYLSSRWSLEATLGVGYAYLSHERFECNRCGEKRGSGHTHYIGPTRLGVSLIYLFK